MPLSPTETTAIARAIVVALCGGRWVSPPVRFVDTYPVTESGRVILSGRPVIEIHSVTVAGKVLTPDQYTVYSGMVLDMSVNEISQLLCGRPTEVVVDYTYGSVELPPLVERAITKFAEEVALADANDANCRIPERVTSVTRQGVSWTLLDPQDFLDDGRTGIYEVDLAIKAINPAGAHRRSRVFSTRQSAPALRRPAS